MRKFLLLLGLTVASWPTLAALNVFVTTPEWASLVKAIGEQRVNVYVATTAFQDPHRIEAKPSLLAQARRAQLLVAVGAELEVGWLPLVLRDAGNLQIQPGQPGYFEATSVLRLLDVPRTVDRAQGDVHAAGNPHAHLDPRNVLLVGEALSKRLATLDPAGQAAYTSAWQAFSQRWQAAMGRWEKQAAPLKGVAVLSHHTSFRYLTAWLGMVDAGSLEPKPGIEPTSAHLSQLVSRQAALPVRMVLRTGYQAEGPSRWFGEKTGVPAVMLPYTVGGTPEANDLFGLYDDTIQRLLKALP